MQVSYFVEKLINNAKLKEYKNQRRRLTSQLNRIIHLITKDDPKKYSKQRCECGHFLTWKELQHYKKNLNIKKLCQECKQ